GLADQPRQFRQRIALGAAGGIWIAAAAVVVLRGIRSVLISISHRDDASPSTGSQIVRQTNGHLPVPSHIPMRTANTPIYRISVGAWTPRTARPDARTETTPWTNASRAFVISASSSIMKRKCGNSFAFE